MTLTQQPQRLSAKEALILKLLVSSPRDRYGLDMVETSEGQLKRGTIYVTLGRMEEKGYVSSRREATDEASSVIPRRLYKPTGLGRAVLQAHENYVHALTAAGAVTA